ncbi:MAG: transcriptional regulator NrdR [Candidatus Komeilibacteria bacterium]
MQCPLCLKKETKVLDSRLIADGFAVRRRRECQACNFRFSTYEEMEILNITVVKRDGRRENYSRDKMARGIEKALEKRSYTSDDFKKLLNRIERDIQKLRRDEITSNKLGEIVIKQLKKFDKIAYIRFASVYYSFEDVKSFTKEIRNLKIKK